VIPIYDGKPMMLASSEEGAWRPVSELYLSKRRHSLSVRF